ncbi:hypothetical protein AGABI2DRAFT_78952 [Agaricus bisporus var. bisporus H97]|uniref:hypothetical protein n=1 Tax=Agaricus bisporus var. bisporus (strain H97 / ATCC MYA-4626 / FGSC 10389) TaxID=936046 RepID=UPI00029F74A1|nr:hypothetical protein AGABI2DRAFT_78952 [Agaricus bisporus var. bisporus H97]EKV42172.1 hypothetical protein AGABI2DRAFT_78952 [Agaricus bisporus var. bisporus H97]
MHSTNRRCNTLQAVVGLYLQACGTPEAVIKLVSHLGISISSSSINDAITSLSAKAEEKMQDAASKFTTAYAYDNLDVNLKHGTPTLENSHESTIVHLTSASMFPLNHGVTANDLDCGDTLHEIFANPVPIRMEQLEDHFSTPNTPATNGHVLEGILAQAHVGDSHDPNIILPASSLPPTRNKVLLFFGDLLTVQHLRSLMLQRIDESRPFRRLQFIVCVPGLFHFKMACADAIWRAFISPVNAKKGTNMLLSFVKQLRKNDVKKLTSKPDFRPMHEVIQHSGIVHRLDLWRIAVKKYTDSKALTLEDWATMEPSWEDVYALSEKIAVKHIFPLEMDESRNGSSRDKINENMRLFHQQCLLYEETIYAMDHGDIGRLEETFLPWIHFFAGCGKHKYAAEMTRYLENVHFRYPKPLSRAIRMNILVNPTGRPNHFRAVDWVIELNNLYIKRIHGGQYSNRSVERMIKESPLIETYKDIRRQLEDMFCLGRTTTHHSPTDMKSTFDRLAEYLIKEKTNEYIQGREAEHEVKDMMAEGLQKIAMGETNLAKNNETEDLETVELEVEDDGTLDL